MNKIDLIVKYSTEAFDEVYKADARSSLLDGNKKLMQFTGAKTVKIAKFTSDGLSDYSRANSSNENLPLTSGGDFAQAQGNSFTAGYGYQRADMGITWEEFTLACDRGAQYRVELFDNEESAELAVGLGTKQINKQVIVPEVDAYCFSKIASYVPASNTITAADTISLTAGDPAEPVNVMNQMFLKLDEAEVPAEDQIIFASPTFIQALRSTNALYKKLDQAEYKKNVSFLIEEYEGRPIVMVPPSRFMTGVSLNAKGYGPTASVSKHIHCMLVAKEAVYHIVKYNKIKVFGPEVVQDYDGYKINARVYHDVFVPDNKRVALAIWTKSTAITGSTLGAITDVVTVKGGSATKTIVKSLLVKPLSQFVEGLYWVEEGADGYADVAVGGTVIGSAFGLGDVLTLGNAAHKIKIMAKVNGKIFAFVEVTPVLGA